MTSPRDDQSGFASASVDISRADRLLLYRRPDGTARSLDEAAREMTARSETLETATACLALLLSGGYAVWTDGKLYEARALVEMVGNLRMVIHTREHGPPHFHVTGGGINASFAITDCAHLMGDVDGRTRRLVEYWHSGARDLLVKKWNETRPSDCPVGPIAG